MFKKILAPTFFLLFAFPGITQTTDPALESARLSELSKKLEGTYQLQIINSRELGEIPLQYMDTIVARRHAVDTTYFIYPNKPQMRLMILPQSVISQANFSKLARIVHVVK